MRFVTFVSDNNNGVKKIAQPKVNLAQAPMKKEKPLETKPIAKKNQPQEKKYIPIPKKNHKDNDLAAKLVAPIARQAKQQLDDPIKNALEQGKKSGKELLANVHKETTVMPAGAPDRQAAAGDNSTDVNQNNINKEIEQQPEIVTKNVTHTPTTEQSLDDRIRAIDERQSRLSCFEKTSTVPAVGKPLHLSPDEAVCQEPSLSVESESNSNSEGGRTTGQQTGSGQLGHGIHGGKGKNIIALTRGYVEKVTGEHGTDAIDRDGDPTKQPSLEEIKFLAYEAKINWSLQNAWQNNFRNHRWQALLEGDAVVEFAIDVHGRVQNSTLLQSTGHQTLDDMIMKTISFASPFPPFPSSFGDDLYTTGRRIMVRASTFDF